MNKSAKVRMLLRRNPNVKAGAVVETIDCTMQQAHVMLNTQRKQLGIIKLRECSTTRGNTKYRGDTLPDHDGS